MSNIDQAINQLNSPDFNNRNHDPETKELLPSNYNIAPSKNYKKDQISKDNNNVFLSNSLLSTLIQPSIHLFKNNDEFRYISCLFIAWINLTLVEFIYGLIGDGNVISDSFFNTFKTICFLIPCLSLLFSRFYSIESKFLMVRLELISAAAGFIFLVIVSVYMLLQSLHLITEDEDLDLPITFFKWLYVIKAIIDITALMYLSDYITHPMFQVKLFLWKKIKEWKQLNEISMSQLKLCAPVLKIWNNHYENMNSLCVNLISDLSSSILFIIQFYVFGKHHYALCYLTISLFNFIIVLVLVKPLFRSVLKILMQGRNEAYESFYSKLNKEITYFNGCLGVKEMKFWMIAQNEVKAYIKIYGDKNIDRVSLNHLIHSIADEIELNFDCTLEIAH